MTKVRSLSIVVLVVSALVLTMVAAGCAGSSESAGVSTADLSAEQILTKAMAASETATSAKGSFEVAMSFDVDPSQLPEEAKAFVDKPMVISGTLAYGADPQALDLTVNASMMGQVIDMALKMADKAAYVRFKDQWYEAPAEMMQMMGDPAAQTAQNEQMMKALSDLGIDPMTWMKDLQLVGEETIEGAGVYHLAATPDFNKIMTDMLTLMQSGKLNGMLDPVGSMGMMGSSALPTMPDAEDLKEMQAQLDSILGGLAFDLWIAKDTFMPVKATASARITPPAGEEAQGLNAVNLSATVSLQDVNKPVMVEPPVDAKPWSDLEKAMKDDPGMFGPMFGMGLGGSIAVPDTTVQ